MGGDTFSGGGESAAELRDDVERLEQLLLQQHKRLEAIENGDLTPPTPSQKSSRRDLLRKAGLAAAAATGGLVFLEAAPATAATGGDFLLGEENNADATTTLVPTPGSSPSELLFVDNLGATGSEATGILAYGNTGGSGVVGYAPSTQSSVAGVGVVGFNTAGIAVLGAAIGAQEEQGGGFLGGIDLAAMGLGRIMQVSTIDSGPPIYTPNDFEQIRDSSGGLWLSQTTSTDSISNISSWRPSLSFVPLATPVRKISGIELTLNAAPTLSADLRDGLHIPGNAVAIAGNLAMTVHAFASKLNGAGVLAIAPGGTSQAVMGGIASINAGNGALADSNHVAVGFGTGSDAGKVSLYYYGGGGPPSHIDVYLDVVGYYA